MFPFSLREKVPEGRMKVRLIVELARWLNPHPSPLPTGEEAKRSWQ